MITIKNRFIPFGTYKAINLFGLVFTKFPLSHSELNHEKIHSRQLVELLVIGFYLWYVVEWLIRIIQFKNLKRAYFNICFEREAYANEANLNYLKHRKWYSSFQYLKNK